MAAFDWTPAPDDGAAEAVDLPPARDLDGDGVTDEWDACPSLSGPARPLDRARHGCPDPADGDGDGIVDEIDACPGVRGVPSGELARHGCPPPDRDADGVADSIDACPDTAGARTHDALRSGCPADSDADGINDDDDACPNAAGGRSRDPAQHGCPLARVEQGGIELLEPVKFATASSRILPESSPLLDAVAELLLRH